MAKMPRFSPFSLNFWANCRLARIMFEFRGKVETNPLLAHETNEFNHMITRDVYTILIQKKRQLLLQLVKAWLLLEKTTIFDRIQNHYFIFRTKQKQTDQIY